MTPSLRARIVPVLVAVVACTIAPAPAASLRVATLNVELGLGAPGTTGYEATAAVLARLDADVVALQEVQGADLEGNPSALQSLASALGYPTLHLAETTGVLDLSQRVCLLSRHPLSAAANIAPPPGAKDMTRQIPAVVIDVPDVDEDPTILTLHLKCCYFDLSDPFRRAVELFRATSHLEASGLSPSDNIIVLGDFNLIGSDLTIASVPAGLPASFLLGPDVPLPITYHGSPEAYFAPWSITDLQPRQLDGSLDTAGSSRLDHILASTALTDRPHASEIYNSALDTANDQGLPKAGPPLAAGTSSAASDHFALFADFELTSLPALSLASSATELREDDPSGSARLIVTLPAPPGPGESVVVTLTSSDPTEAIPAQPMVTLPAGVTTREVDIVPQTDALLDGRQPVTFTASAAGFSPASVGLEVIDTDRLFFSLETPGDSYRQEFAGFDGTADPAGWHTSAGLPWRGVDTGDSALPGKYSYGDDPALGVLLSDQPATLEVFYRQFAEAETTALLVSYDAEQWRSSRDGAPDLLTVELVDNASAVTPLPELTFTADTTLPSGPIPGGTSTTRSTIVTGLGLEFGAPFSLRFTATPGEGGTGAGADDLFLNELHYDNTGTDAGEFLEVVVGPAYQGPLANAAALLYNGNGGNLYATHTLDTFTPGETTPSGHRLFSKLVAGIQNGSPDGIAIVVGEEVLHFLSYEGSFTATSGPASGMTSVDIGVQQDNPIPESGTGILALTGAGSDAADFTWTRLPADHSRGLVNAGQELSAPRGPQGIAIDNLSVTLLVDTDHDGDPDLTDPDDDGDGLPDAVEPSFGTDPLLADTDGNGIDDGEEDADRDSQSNLAELLVTLTDPLDPSSRFEVEVAPDPAKPDGVVLTFPTLPGRRYAISHSINLEDWNELDVRPGDGSVFSLAVDGHPASNVNIFRVTVTLP